MNNLDLEYIYEYLTNGKFQTQCPAASKTLATSIKYMKSILYIADQVCAKTNSNKPIIFSMSVDQLTRTYNRFNYSATDKKTIYQNINVLAYHKLITKIDDSDAPKELLNDIIEFKKQTRYRLFTEHIQIYMIPRFSASHLVNIEDRAKTWISNHYKKFAFTYETIYRCEGYKIASEIYPQYKEVINNKTKEERKPSLRSDNRSLKISEYILNSISSYGYCIESDIPKAFNCSKKTIQKYLPEIIGLYDIQRIPCTKKIKEDLNIQTNGYPYIYVLK